MVATLCAIAGLGACTSALTPLGENTYDCNRKENPNSPYCHSFKSVERATNGNLPPSRFDEAMSIADHDRLTGIAPNAVVPARRTEVPGAAPGGVTGLPRVGAAASLEGLPVRVGPVVQRIWVKRFVDRNDLLVGDTVIYKEIIGSHWLGFDAPGATAAGAATGGAREVYPHRPPAPAPAAALKAPNANDVAAPREAAPASKRFTQPGAAAPASAGVVSAPATEAPASESGVSVMPQ